MYPLPTQRREQDHQALRLRAVFLNKLASASCELTAEAFLIDAHIRISVQLQRGNAAVFQRGMQQLRLEQSVMAGGDKPIGGGAAPHPPSRRRQQRLFHERMAGGATSG